MDDADLSAVSGTVAQARQSAFLYSRLPPAEQTGTAVFPIRNSVLENKEALTSRPALLLFMVQ
jgi:hypothetical protein